MMPPFAGEGWGEGMLRMHMLDGFIKIKLSWSAPAEEKVPVNQSSSRSQ